MQVCEPQGAEQGNDEALAQGGKSEGQPGNDTAKQRGFHKINQAHKSHMLFVLRQYKPVALMRNVAEAISVFHCSGVDVQLEPVQTMESCSFL